MTSREDVEAMVRAAVLAHPTPVDVSELDAATRRVLARRAEAEGRTPACILADAVAEETATLTDDTAAIAAAARRR